MTSYEWKGGRGHHVPAQTVGETIKQIEEKYGTCHPAKLVDAARPADSPIHTLFDWDDQQAAEKHRIDQARGIIRSLRVVKIEGDKQEEKIAFVSVSRAEEPRAGYASVERAMSEESTRKSVVQDAIRQLNGLRMRYQHLTELAEVWDSIEQLQEKAS